MNLGFSDIIRYKRFVLNIQNKWIEMGFYCTNDVIIFNYEVMREVASRRFIRPSVVLCYRIIEFVCVSMLTNSNVRNKNACENRTFLSNTDQILRYFFSSSEQEISLILFFFMNDGKHLIRELIFKYTIENTCFISFDK